MYNKYLSFKTRDKHGPSLAVKFGKSCSLEKTWTSLVARGKCSNKHSWCSTSTKTIQSSNVWPPPPDLGQNYQLRQLTVTSNPAWCPAAGTSSGKVRISEQEQLKTDNIRNAAELATIIRLVNVKSVHWTYWMLPWKAAWWTTLNVLRLINL